jgi:hypothetical protein
MNDFKNGSTLAYAVNEIVNNRFVARPYNYYQPDKAIWYLVPSTEWPAYKHGKLFFDPQPGKVPGENGGIYCGFEVEKGMGSTAAQGYGKRPEVILKDDWLWRRFVSNITKELPAVPPEQLVTVELDYEPPSHDSAPAKDFQFGRATFKLSGDQRLTLLEPPNLNPLNPAICEHFNSHVCAQTNLEGLVGQLQRLPEWDWLWVTVYIGIVASGGSTQDLWVRYLKPWTPWLTH